MSFGWISSIYLLDLSSEITYSGKSCHNFQSGLVWLHTAVCPVASCAPLPLLTALFTSLCMLHRVLYIHTHTPHKHGNLNLLRCVAFITHLEGTEEHKAKREALPRTGLPHVFQLPKAEVKGTTIKALSSPIIYLLDLSIAKLHFNMCWLPQKGRLFFLGHMQGKPPLCKITLPFSQLLHSERCVSGNYLYSSNPRSHSHFSRNRFLRKSI